MSAVSSEHSFSGKSEPIAVDVLMLAYNVAPFIEEALNGILSQRVDFSVRIVIAEDGSTDDTQRICARAAKEHPGKILYLPGERNIGVAARTAAGLVHCKAKYLAICDSDDVWIDPDKLAVQVAFLEAHPDHGLSYSDVEIMARDGSTLSQDPYDAVRASYCSGKVFVNLLQGNFINNSTAVVRSELLTDHTMDERREHYVQDLLMWMHVAMRTKVHFLPRRTTAYRVGGISGNSEAAFKSRATMRDHAGAMLMAFATTEPDLQPNERAILFRKVLGLLVAPVSTWRTRFGMLGLLVKFTPTTFEGWRHVLGIRKIVLNEHRIVHSTA